MKPVLWTNKEISEALELTQPPVATEATGVSIDTRTLQSGDLYIAIRGEKLDGHAFVEEALAKGAVAVVVDHLMEGCPSSQQIVVGDTLKALAQLGTFARKRTKATTIGVTGSVGKTTTKELLRHILEDFGITYASPASYNNHWGLPFTLATMPQDAVYGVVEIGTNHPGEIAPLAMMACPHISIITAIAESHIEALLSLQGIAEEKSDIFACKPPPSLAIINQDCFEFGFMRDKAVKCGVSKILGFGKTQDADIRLINCSYDSTEVKSTVTAMVQGQKVIYTLPQPGEHVAIDSLIGLAIGEALGLDQKRVLQRLATISSVKGRGQHLYIPVKGGEIHLIDDAFNANLTSVKAGLAVLGVTSPKEHSRRIVVFGEMLELANFAESHHQQIMEAALNHQADLVFATGGPVIEKALHTIPEKRIGGYAPNAEALIPMVMEVLRPGDVVFVKGSKGSCVSKVVDALVNRETQAG